MVLIRAALCSAGGLSSCPTRGQTTTHGPEPATGRGCDLLLTSRDQSPTDRLFQHVCVCVCVVPTHQVPLGPETSVRMLVREVDESNKPGLWPGSLCPGSGAKGQTRTCFLTMWNPVEPCGTQWFCCLTLTATGSQHTHIRD